MCLTDAAVGNMHTCISPTSTKVHFIGNAIHIKSEYEQHKKLKKGG